VGRSCAALLDAYDPTGLAPEWNEDNNHWFSLRSEVEDGGGNVSWANNTATVSMYGVTVDFKSVMLVSSFVMAKHLCEQILFTVQL